jgi:pimeloyl-ACP methyl ester carboxylesterase
VNAGKKGVPMGVRRVILVTTIVLAAASCTDEAEPPGEPSAISAGGRVDVGGYELAWQCVGEGTPTVVLDAGLDTAGSSDWLEVLPQLASLHARVCTYDRAGTGGSDPRPADGAPTAGSQAIELHELLDGAGIEPPYVLVPHSYAGLIARVYADRYPDDVAGFVFEDVSTAWEIDLWRRWDDSPWIDGGQRTDIRETEREVLRAAPMGARPTVVVSQDTYAEEGVPGWAGPIFARHQARLASLGDDVVHVRAAGSGHWVHRDRPEVMVSAIGAVVGAVRAGTELPACAAVFSSTPSAACVPPRPVATS